MIHMAGSIISDASAQRLAQGYHSSSPRDRNITAVSHGLTPPDGWQGFRFEVQRELTSTLGDDPDNARELRALLDWGYAQEFGA